ncbi:MAG: hypothetical protein ABSG86_04960 [Thermoguttaceae bacterium]|jgi:hypothetical protein
MFRSALGLCFILLSGMPPECVAELPVPKAGLLVPKDQAGAVRQHVLALGEERVLVKLRAEADRMVAEWPNLRPEIAKHVGDLLDVRGEHNPREFVPAEARAAAEKLDPLLKNSAKLGFLYFLTGQRKYAETAAEVLDVAGRVPRWGWFNWDGANMPQIHYGMFARSAAFAVDFCWEGWSPAQRRRAAEVLAERCVEPYWRLVSLSPFMALHHLRAKNQGNNALGAALVASVALGDSHPDNRVWLASLLQTYSWIVAHDIGWAGTNLESGLPGYWDISMSNLYTAAACVYNARGVDFRVHPAFAEATWYPVMKEATVPFAPAPFDKPYPRETAGLWGIMQHKPIELPSSGFGGPWWYDYAAHFPQSPAAYFISKQFGRVENPHQEGHFELMDLLWVRTMRKPERPPAPTLLFKATDREAMFRSGYGSPHTFLSFNGDCFLSARSEVLGCTSGLAWHFPWHQFAVTESALETEGRPFSPSMLITDSFDSPQASAVGSKSWTSNVRFYARPEQARSYLEYRARTRDILYVRSERRDQVPDYFVFVDRVAHDSPRWHAFNWHVWNRPGNEGSYEIVDSRTAIARRPNAALLLATLSHDRMTYEQQGMPSQPTTAYVFDHNALLLRAIAGRAQKPAEPVRMLPAASWSAGEMVEAAGKRVRHFADFQALHPVLSAPLTLSAGARYRLSVPSRKKNAWVDDNILWVLDVDLLDAAGRAVRKLEADPRSPDPLRLTDPASGTPGECDWREAVSYFDAPPGVAAARATLRFAQYTNNGPGITKGSELWLGDIEVAPLGTPERRDHDLLVTLVMPLKNQGPHPRLTFPSRGGAAANAELVHPDGTQDHITVAADGGIQVEHAGPDERAAIGWKVANLSLGSVRAGVPLAAAVLERGGKLTGRFVLPEKAEVSVAGKSRSLEAGAYVYDGQFRRDPAAVSLRTNSAESQRALKEGLARLAREIVAERDRPLAAGRKNLALEAEVTASGVRDPRFDARHVTDNETWEFPIDGVLDYTLGEIETPGNGGYGRGDGPSFTQNLSTWPLYIRPTYWLLPPRQTGWLTLKLKQPAPVRLVRLLNTTNAGLNDFATVDFEVELLDDALKVVSRHAGSFGRVWDRAFRSALVKPKFFAGYGPAFSGMLEPGAKVPFGSGWQEIVVDRPVPVRYVRVKVLSYWAMGGGLNEVQVFP